MGVRSDELLRDFDSKKKTGAGGGDVETGRILRTDFLLHETGRRWEQHVWSRGRNQNKIDIFGFNFCLFESVEGSLARHVAGGFIFCGNATLFDSGADGDPLVARVDYFGKVGIGQALFRRVTAGADNRNGPARFTGVRPRVRARLSFHDNGGFPRRYAG